MKNIIKNYNNNNNYVNEEEFERQIQLAIKESIKDILLFNEEEQNKISN